jgi:hypothetical protein
MSNQDSSKNGSKDQVHRRNHLLLSSMTNMMTFYSVLSISRWSVVTLHPLLKASPQKFYSRHTESVDKYGVSISTGAPNDLAKCCSFILTRPIKSAL